MVVTSASVRQPLDLLSVAVDDLRAGRPVVVVDDADRENEGDLVMAAEFATAETLGFFVRWTSGLICAPMAPEVADRLDLPLMVPPVPGTGTASTDTTPYTRAVGAHGGGGGVAAPPPEKTRPPPPATPPPPPPAPQPPPPPPP
ncbi:3,4-dihydroxy-2-butanone-4-phosphate synthase [Streptomyces sp. NPDC001089]